MSSLSFPFYFIEELEVFLPLRPIGSWSQPRRCATPKHPAEKTLSP